MTHWKRLGLSFSAISTVLIFILWRRILPFPLLVLTSLYIVANYFIAVRKIKYRGAPLIIGMIAIPMGYFVYQSSNAVSFWMTYALAILLAAGVSLIAFRLDKA